MEIQAPAGESWKTVLVDIEDYERLAGRAVSMSSNGYAQIWERPHMMSLHRWIMRVPHGTGYQVLVDHINRDRLDCRKLNLRLVTPTESNLNRAIRQRDLPVGVHRAPSGRYAVSLKRNRISRYVGTFDTPEEAARARQEVLEG